MHALMRPLFSEFTNRDTNPSAVTSGCTKGTRFPSTEEADRAHSSRVESVPFMATGAKPTVVFPRRPTTKRTSNARSRRLLVLLLLKLTI